MAKIPTIEIKYEPNDRQVEFHKNGATELVYGGAKGGGKTAALVMEAFAYGLEYAGAIIYLFRETFDDLEANVIAEWKKRIPPELYSYNETKHLATLYNGTKVYFRFVKDKGDAGKYDGRSMDWIGVDELTKHEEETIQQLMSCMRSPLGFPVRFRGSCNPGGLGHNWVKKRYIASTDYGKKSVKDEITGNSIAFIPATVYDNHAIMMNDPAYVRRLENLPPKKREAYLHGNWDMYDGQAFEEWDPEIHVLKPFKIPNHWPRWMSVDNGYTDPFAWYWFTVDEYGLVYVYREFTRMTNEPKLTYTEQAEKVLELSTHTVIEAGTTRKVREPYGIVYAGHDAFATHPLAAGKTIAMYYQKAGVKPVVTSVPDRRLRKATFHEYLKPFPFGEKMVAKVRIFENCKKLVETLPQQCEDEKDPEKVMESSYDHWFDGCLTGDTIINTLEGDVPISELVGKSGQLHCYDIENEEHAVGDYCDVRLTRENTEIYEILLEDGRKIKATGDHLIMTQDGWKQTVELTENDSIVDIAYHL